jgi:prevent-host-death family protein
MAETVNVHEAKTHLSRLLERVRRGATVIIAKAGQPIAQLVPIGEGPVARQVREARTLPVARTSTDRSTRLRRLMQQEVWPGIPDSESGRALTRQEEDEILGYGTDGT